MSFYERAVEAIRGSGGRMTTQRAMLLEVLQQVDDIDAETLHRLASVRDSSLSLPTVYRTLHVLEAADVITAQYVSDDHERRIYRPRHPHNTHTHATAFHFTCRRCGSVVTFTTDTIRALKSEIAAQLGVEVQSLCMCAGGLCADCRAVTEETSREA